MTQSRRKTKRPTVAAEERLIHQPSADERLQMKDTTIVSGNGGSSVSERPGLDFLEAKMRETLALAREAKVNREGDLLESLYQDFEADNADYRHQILESLQRNDTRQFIVTLTGNKQWIRFDPAHALTDFEQLALADLNHRIRNERELHVLMPFGRLDMGDGTRPFWIIGILLRNDHEFDWSQEVKVDGR